ncbi:hypothetical protein, partial [Pseudomonas lactis]|uniref:hypothetical protein n=1 Tax=Pseudomonas lactis TaxID=1615674 RepID=UPI001F31A709
RYGITFVTQVAIFNVAAALTAHLRRTSGPKVVVPDIAAVLAIGFGFAISALIAVTDIAATSMGVGTQHQ